MRLVDFYREDLKGLTAKERLAVKRLWHRAAVRYLYMLSITSDVHSPLPVRQVRVNVMDRDSETYPVRTEIRGRFFLSRSIDELVELYRATKSPGRVIAP